MNGAYEFTYVVNSHADVTMPQRIQLLEYYLAKSVVQRRRLLYRIAGVLHWRTLGNISWGAEHAVPSPSLGTNSDSIHT